MPDSSATPPADEHTDTVEALQRWGHAIGVKDIKDADPGRVSLPTSDLGWLIATARRYAQKET